MYLYLSCRGAFAGDFAAAFSFVALLVSGCIQDEAVESTILNDDQGIRQGSAKMERNNWSMQGQDPNATRSQC
jgi:hypothetical protein